MSPLARWFSLCSFGLLQAAALAADAPAPAVPLHTLPAPGSRLAQPQVNPASDEAINAIQRMKLVDGLEIKLWAAEPMLGNPVAFNIDEKGRIFVAETYRYRTSLLDIRDYRWMLEDDLAMRTVDEHLALIKKHFGDAGIKELSQETELVRLLEDTDGHGFADKSTVYADGFNTPLDGIASGVLARRGEVWFTDMPSLWKFSGEKKAETRTELSRGYGVRYSFTGHDLHGLTWGPDGKIYFSFGDRGANVKTKEGTTIASPDMGAVFRMNPDGTQLERFADGLRNPQSLLFTENGDLFTGDNDSDSPDEERLVHVVENGDSGWRIGYQHSPLAPVEIKGPWSAEKLWVPRFADQAAYILPPICNIEDGPSGVAYYPGTGLNASYFGQIFICHFKGGVARSGIYTYKVKPAGASYAIADSKPFITSVLPTDVRFGPDGKMYISDWVDGYPKSKRGRIYTISDPKQANDPLVKETKAILASDWPKKSADELARLLGHADWRVRLEAQYTLAERGAASIPVLSRVATTSAPPAGELGDPANLPAFARRHAIWGLGQIAAKNAAALAALKTLVSDNDPEVRAQSLKVLGDHRQVDQGDAMIAALQDPSGRVKFFAAQSLGKVASGNAALAAKATPALLAALQANNDVDAYLRHALVMGLVGGNDLAGLTAAMNASAKPVRLGVLLALRRLERPEIAQLLADPDPFLVREAALAINDRPIAGAMPALAAMLEKAGDDQPLLYRAINANFRLGREANAQALVRFATNRRVSEKFRAEALAQLGNWAEPPARDRVVGVFRPLAAATRVKSAAHDALIPALPALLDPKLPFNVFTAAITAVEKLAIAEAADALVPLVGNDSLTETSRISALNTLDKIKDPRLPEVVRTASESTNARLRLAALPITARLSPEVAAPALANFVARGSNDEKKAAFEALGTLRHPTADTILAEQLGALAAGKVPVAAQVELLEAAAKRDNTEIKKLLADRDARLAAGTDPVAAFQFALAGGNRENGQRVFETHPLACIRCHRVGTATGGDAGPNLAEVGTRLSRQLILESVVKPSAKIAAGFDANIITRRAGGLVAGIVAGETDTAISLRQPDGKVVEVPKSEIAKRETAPSSMPEVYGALLTKTELRDVVEYLSSLRAFGGGRGGRGGGNIGGRGADAPLPPPRALRGLTAAASATPVAPQPESTHP